MEFLQHLPQFLKDWVPPWMQALGLFIIILLAGQALKGAVYSFATRRAEKWHPLFRHILRRSRRLAGYVVLLFALAVALPLAPLSKEANDNAHRLFLALFVVQLGWMAIVAANIAIDHYVDGLKLDATDNLLARKAVTQMRILRRAANAMLVLLTLGLALMSFSSVRQFGISLFASAGMAGIVAGLAARPLLENLIAGLQLAFTQPVRMGDAVVIAGEWGWVEEIGSVYIVIRLWDWRRQVVPLSYLFENPFTNWTRSTSSLIGSVYVYMDYTIPMDKIRAKATEIVQASKIWDGQVVNVQVSDCKEQVVEVRVLASAADSPKTWDLRCEVREKLIAYIQETYPQSLPRQRREDYKGAMQSPGALPVSRQTS